MSVFSLRKLEMSMPFIEALKKNEPKALVQVAAIALADEQTLKLVAAGNNEALQVFVDKAYDMPSDEVAQTISFFLIGSQRFTLIQAGLKPEEVNTLMSQKSLTLRESLGIQSQEN